MRLVHFSDVHAGGFPQSFGGWFDKRLLGAANYWLRRRGHHDWSLIADMIREIEALEPDLVVCTGDHSSISEPVEFERALQALAPLIDNSSFDLLFVPGNHDWYVKAAECEAALADAVQRMTRGTIGLRDYPLLKTFRGESFLLVNQACPQGWLSSAGAISADAASKIGNILDCIDKPITLISHFPLYAAGGELPSARRHCRNNEVLDTAFRDGRIKLAMCGHIHTPFSRTGPGAGVEVCAGSLTFAGKLSVVDYDESGTFEQHWREVR